VFNDTTFERMFSGCKAFDSGLCHCHWLDVSGCSSSDSDPFGLERGLCHLFYLPVFDCHSFDSDISGWNVAIATNFYGMLLPFIQIFQLGMWPTPLTSATCFLVALRFIQNVSGWNVTNATNWLF
jgi:Mycoplasma protein of unknown function, DUF285